MCPSRIDAPGRPSAAIAFIAASRHTARPLRRRSSTPTAPRKVALCHDLDHANAPVLATAPVVAATRARLGLRRSGASPRAVVLAADPVAGRRTATWKRALDAVETALHGAPPSLWHVSTRRSSPLGSCDAFSESGSRPPSGCVESDASRGSRGALAVPASPSAG